MSEYEIDLRPQSCLIHSWFVFKYQIDRVLEYNFADAVLSQNSQFFPVRVNAMRVTLHDLQFVHSVQTQRVGNQPTQTRHEMRVDGKTKVYKAKVFHQLLFRRVSFDKHFLSFRVSLDASVNDRVCHGQSYKLRFRPDFTAVTNEVFQKDLMWVAQQQEDHFDLLLSIAPVIRD